MKIGRKMIMIKKNDELHTQLNRNTVLTEELNRLEKVLVERESKRDRSLKKVDELERQYQYTKQSNLWRLLQFPKDAKQMVRTTLAYLLGRRDRRQLYSKAYKRKKAQNELKNLKYYLYTLGFIK